jgi:hypothetical protein
MSMWVDQMRYDFDDSHLRFLVAVPFNRLYSTGVSGIHSEESSRRGRHGGFQGMVLKRTTEIT